MRIDSTTAVRTHDAGRRRSPVHRAVALAFAVLTPVVALTAAAGSGGAAGTRQMVFGAFTKPLAGQTQRQAIEQLETKLGHRLGASREYLSWDSSFPVLYHTWLKEGGRTPLMSVRTRRGDGTNILWKSIAAATAGTTLHNEMVSWADRVKSFGAPVYFTMSHEPEASTNTALGTPAEFVAAWRAFIQVFRDRGVTNAKFLWIMTDYAFSAPTTDRRNAAKWYPGDAWIDAAAIDAYNWHQCRVASFPLLPLRDIIEPFRKWGLSHPSEELWLAEFGSMEDVVTPNASRKGAWIGEAQALFKEAGYTQFRGISYYNAPHPAANYPKCTWWITSSTTSLSAATKLAADPFYAGLITPPPTPPTTTLVPPIPTATFVAGSGAAPVAGDVTVIDRLRQRGYKVTVIDDSAVTEAMSADVIVLSSSVDPGTIGSKLRSTPSPVVTYKAWMAPRLQLSSLTAVGDVASATSVTMSSTSAYAAGRTGTVAITSAARGMFWVDPVASGEIVAKIAGHGAYVAFEKGDVLADGFSSPSCRSVVPLRHDQTAVATADLWAFFDKAVDIAAAC